MVRTELLHPNPESPFYTTFRRTLCNMMRAGFRKPALKSVIPRKRSSTRIFKIQVPQKLPKLLILRNFSLAKIKCFTVIECLSSLSSLCRTHFHQHVPEERSKRAGLENIIVNNRHSVVTPPPLHPILPTDAPSYPPPPQTHFHQHVPGDV